MAREVRHEPRLLPHRAEQIERNEPPTQGLSRWEDPQTLLAAQISL